MGLDITAYSQVVWIEPYYAERFDELYDYSDTGPKYASVTKHTDFPARQADMKHGIYRVDGERFGFRAGAYSGYNRWRNWLSVAALGVTAETIWSDREAWTGQPFYELIDFSDCEGTLGTAVCQKLLKDFEAFTPPADTDDWDADLYQKWTKAFRIGSDGGCVDFH